MNRNLRFLSVSENDHIDVFGMRIEPSYVCHSKNWLSLNLKNEVS